MAVASKKTHTDTVLLSGIVPTKHVELLSRPPSVRVSHMIIVNVPSKPFDFADVCLEQHFLVQLTAVIHYHYCKMR